VVHREHGDNAELLARLDERCRNELLDSEERLELRDELRCLKRKLETAAETVDAFYSGLERIGS
jgi:hypothetical protein